MFRRKAIFGARALGLGLVLLIFGGSAQAQTIISGVVYDGNGGPLLSGQVYHVTGSGIAVPFGQTLTVQSGAIVKFDANTVSISGTLDIDGTALDPAVFTSIQDDSAGGDTNGNGPSVGSPGDWLGLTLYSGAVDAEHAEIRYAGASPWAPIYGSGGAITLRSCTISDSAGPGIDLNGVGGIPTIENCSFDDNATYPIQEATIHQIAGFWNNTASGHGIADCILVTTTSPTADVTVRAGECINDVLVFANGCTIPSGITLTLEAGVTIKWSMVGVFYVDGRLVFAGTATSPVVITTFADDDYSGDTNKNGPSSGSPGEWYGIFPRPTGSIDLDHAVVRYAGAAGAAGILGTGGSVTVKNSLIADSLGAGIDLSNLNLLPTIEGCSIDHNGTYAVQNATIDTIPGFENNTASGNGVGDYIFLTHTTPAADVTIRASNCLNGALVFASSSRINAGIALTLSKGVVVKWSGPLWLEVAGSLNVQGVYGEPVVMTSLADDDYAGDTNKDGPSSGSPGDWYGLTLRSTGAPVIHHSVLRYAGAGGLAPIYNQNLTGRLMMRNTEIRDALGAGIDLSNIDLSATIERCSFDDNGTYAAQKVSIDTIPGFANNTATGNGVGDYIHVTDPQPTGDVTIGPESCLNGVLVFAASTTIPASVTLTLQAGVVVKFATPALVFVNGSLDLEGTAFSPVVLTSLADDQIVGDTNGNGPSAGSAGEWSGIWFASSAMTSSVENALFRYGGQTGSSVITCDSSLVALRSARIEHSAGDGFHASAHSGDAMNWVAFDCAGDGIELTGGSFDVLHATSAGNVGYGILAGIGHNGDVVNSIAWANTLGNLSGYAAGRVRYSDGSAFHAGANGNINADPQFVDPSVSVGDLRLQSSSPCVDTAHAPTAMNVVKDHAEHSRMLDPTLSGTLLPDMGAYERWAWNMTALGEPRSGRRMKFTVQGPAGTSRYLIGLLDGHSLVAPYGFITCGSASLTMLPTIAVGSTYSLVIPRDPALVGIGFGVQTRTWPTGSPSVGSITNLYRAEVLPPRPKKREVEEPLQHVTLAIR